MQMRKVRFKRQFNDVECVGSFLFWQQSESEGLTSKMIFLQFSVLFQPYLVLSFSCHLLTELREISIKIEFESSSASTCCSNCKKLFYEFHNKVKKPEDTAQLDYPCWQCCSNDAEIFSIFTFFQFSYCKCPMSMHSICISWMHAWGVANSGQIQQKCRRSRGKNFLLLSAIVFLEDLKSVHSLLFLHKMFFD